MLTAEDWCLGRTTDPYEGLLLPTRQSKNIYQSLLICNDETSHVHPDPEVPFSQQHLCPSVAFVVNYCT
jgi:hypothetical protein